MKLASRPRNSPIGPTAVVMSPSDRIGRSFLPAEQHHRGDAAEKAAMERHAALPQFEDLGGMLDEERQIVEQHIAGAAAEDDADRDPEDEIVHLQQRDRRRPAPQPLVLDQRAGVDPAQHDAADIGQRIPADRDRPDRDGDRVEHRKGDGEKGIVPAVYDERLRRYSASSRSQCRSAASRW